METPYNIKEMASVKFQKSLLCAQMLDLNQLLTESLTTQSIKKLKAYLKEDALDLSKGWRLTGSKKSYNILKLRTDETLIEKYKDKIFYKERWIKNRLNR